MYALLRLVARLLGCDYMRGLRPHTPVWVQNQRWTTALSDGNEGQDSFHALESNAMSLRAEVMRRTLVTCSVRIRLGVSRSPFPSARHTRS